MRRVANKNKRKKADEPEISEDEDAKEENGTEEEAKVEPEVDDDADVDDAGPAKTKSPAKGKKGKAGKKGSGKKAAKKAKKEVKPEEDEEEEEYEVEAVVGSRYMRGKRQFKIRWRGHGQEEDSWCGEADLHCQDLIDEYLESNPDEEAPAAPAGKKGQKRKAAPAAKSSQEKEDDDDDETEYEVERVREVKFKKNGKREFLVHWKGFSATMDSWEPEENLNCPELINKLMEKVDKAKELAERELRAKPKQTDRLTLSNPQIRTSRRNNMRDKGGRKTYHDLLE